MASRKPSARAKRVSEFKSQLGGMDESFARESKRRTKNAERKEAARREKACSSKNRYATHNDALAAIASCEAYGTTGLHAYRCPYCNGWHLTSKPERD